MRGHVKLTSIVAAVLLGLNFGAGANAVLLVGPGPNVGLLASFSEAASGSASASFDPGIFVGFELTDMGQNQQATIIEQLITSDQTFSLTSGTAFDDAVGFLTNGIVDEIVFFSKRNVNGQPSGSSSSSIPETALTYTTPLSGNLGDLSGAVIREIVYSITNFQFTQGPASTSFSYDYELRILGTPAEVPLPGAIWLMIAGLCGLTSCGRWKPDYSL